MANIEVSEEIYTDLKALAKKHNITVEAMVKGLIGYYETSETEVDLSHEEVLALIAEAEASGITYTDEEVARHMEQFFDEYALKQKLGAA